MLTADLVPARRRGDSLTLPAFDEKHCEQARSVVESLLPIFSANVGRARSELEGALWQPPDSGQAERLRAGLVALIEDDCDFVGGEAVEIEALRDCVFLAAQEYRSRLSGAGPLWREAVLKSVAEQKGISPGDLDGSLFSDIRSAQKLVRVPNLAVSEWVDRYAIAVDQAILLRAVKLELRMNCPAVAVSRQFFQRLKFLQLCFVAERLDDNAFVLFIEGPLGLFRQTTKYGIKLAQLVPLLTQFSDWQLSAQVLWGKQRQPLLYKTARKGLGLIPGPDPPGRPEVDRILAAWQKQKSHWQCTRSHDWIMTARQEICVPDLEFRRSGDTRRYYVEVLGAWSRQAFWKRVDWVAEGLSNVLFLASSALRVKEDVLEIPDAPSCLYVYRKHPTMEKIVEKLEGMTKRAHAT